MTYFDGTLTTLFGRVWSREGDVGIALSLDYANLADRVVVSGRNNVTFSHNCLTTLQAAADAQVNLSVAQLKGALSAAFDTNRTFGTSFVYGSFRSPIARDLSLVTREVGARIDEAGTAMHLWGWYRANPQFVGQELYIIGDLHGIARYRFREVKLETRADGSASGRGGLLVFTAGGEVEGALRATTTTSASNFEVLAWPDGEEDAVNFVRLPPVDRAATMAKGAGLRVVADASVDLSLYDDTPKTLTYEVRRMGDALCGLPWASTRSGVTVEQVRPRPVQGELSACVFTISADGGALLREAGDASRVALDFGVMTSFTRGNAVHELVIDAERVSFTNTSRLPFFRTSANTLDVISENGVRRIGGQLEWQITQGDRRVAGFDVSALHLRCGAADPVDLTPVGEVELVSRADTSEQSRLRLQVIGGMPTGVAGAQSCTVSVEGTARFSAAPSGVRYADQVIQLPEQRRLLTFPAAPSGAAQPNPPQGSSSMSQ